MVIELRRPVSEFSTKILTFYAPTDSEHKFHKAEIKKLPTLRIQTGVF